jgi:hypothetical protein
MFLISGLTTKTGSTRVIDIAGPSEEPGVQFDLQSDSDKQKADKVNLRLGDEFDDPLAIMW